jgi:hypothetical protein
MKLRPPPILAATLLLGLPLAAAAQDGTGARVSPSRPEAVLRAGPPPAAPLGPMAEGIEDPETLVRMAESALGARRLREASDLLERAESRLLTRSELASEADRPAVGGAIGELAAARDAIARRDPAGAGTLISSALQRLGSGEAPAIAALPAAPLTGTTALPGQAWGGGAPPTLREAPREAVVPAQSPATAQPAATPAPLPGIAPQNMPVGGTASPPVPIGPDAEVEKSAPVPGFIPPASSKPPPL